MSNAREKMISDKNIMPDMETLMKKHGLSDTYRENVRNANIAFGSAAFDFMAEEAPKKFHEIAERIVLKMKEEQEGEDYVPPEAMSYSTDSYQGKPRDITNNNSFYFSMKKVAVLQQPPTPPVSPRAKEKFVKTGDGPVSETVIISEGTKQAPLQTRFTGATAAPTVNVNNTINVSFFKISCCQKKKKKPKNGSHLPALK